METLTRTQIDPVGTVEIESDAPATRFFEGLGSFVTFDDKQGGHHIDAVITTSESTRAMRELTRLMANPSELGCAGEVKEFVESRVGGAVDWDKIADRYEQVPSDR